MDTGRGAFEAAIDAALGRGELAAAERLVYADWLDEQNTPEDTRLAAAQRWMVRHRSAPFLETRGSQDAPWGWYTWSEADHDHSDIPVELIRTMPGYRKFESGAMLAKFRTRPDAERALAEALAIEGLRTDD
jgi:uncharacterized protein (TIGR02996 family)